MWLAYLGHHRELSPPAKNQSNPGAGGPWSAHGLCSVLFGKYEAGIDRRGCRKFAMAKRAIRTTAVDVPLPDREGT